MFGVWFTDAELSGQSGNVRLIFIAFASKKKKKMKNRLTFSTIASRYQKNGTVSKDEGRKFQRCRTF